MILELLFRKKRREFNKLKKKIFKMSVSNRDSRQMASRSRRIRKK